MVVFMFACNVLWKIASWFSTGSICRLSGAMRSETWTKTVDVFIRSVKKRYALYTAVCGITGSEIECRFQWCKCRGLLQTSLVAGTHFSRKLNFKPQNAIKRLKYPPQNEAVSVPFWMRYGANGLMTCGSFTSQLKTAIKALFSNWDHPRWHRPRGVFVTWLLSFGTWFVSILFTWLQFTEFGDSLSHNLAFLYDILIHSCRIA